MTSFPWGADQLLMWQPTSSARRPRSKRRSRWHRGRWAGLSAKCLSKTLVILDGASKPCAFLGCQAERLLVYTASMTSLLHTLERRGSVERRPHPTDGLAQSPRQSYAALAQPIIDSQLPAIHAVITQAIGDVVQNGPPGAAPQVTGADQDAPSPKWRTNLFRKQRHVGSRNDPYDS